jgi:hypothetical protein
MKNKKIKTDFDAQSWLFREFLEKMKKNNVKSIFCFTEDKEGNQKSFEFCLTKKQKKELPNFIS